MPRITQPGSWAVNNITNIRACLDSAASVSALLRDFQTLTRSNWLKSNESVTALGRKVRAIDFILTVTNTVFVSWKSVRSKLRPQKVDLMQVVCEYLSLNLDFLPAAESKFGFSVSLVFVVKSRLKG